jgi:predicted enzyme related to lactoylglutathione lyase
MSSVQIEQQSYELHPRDGFTVTHFITVADIERSARYYEKVFGGRIQSLGNSKGASGHIQIANTWLIVNVGGGPTPDKPTVTLSVPDPNHISSFMNFRVADIQACYTSSKSDRAPTRRTVDARPRKTSSQSRASPSELSPTPQLLCGQGSCDANIR